VSYHLVCVHPFGKYVKGQMVTDPMEVAILMDDRDHHFVRITAPDAPAVQAMEPAADADASQPAKRSTRT
jgi:hypothetical protein